MTFYLSRPQKFSNQSRYCKMHDLEKIQQDKRYRFVANNTWLATTINPMKDNLTKLHNNNFFRNVNKRGAT